MYHTMKTIRSNLNQLGSYELNKVSLSCFDDKRYIHEMVSQVMLMVIIKSTHKNNVNDKVDC